MRAGSLFTGCGGLDLAIHEFFGAEPAWMCEADPHCRTVLERHWPGVPIYPDVWQIGPEHGPVDILHGGFPCQDLSVAGNGAGMEQGTRSGLWAAFARAIRVLRPGRVVVENVPGLLRPAVWEFSDRCVCGWPYRRRRVHLPLSDEAEDVHAPSGRGDVSPGAAAVDGALRALRRSGQSLAPRNGEVGGGLPLVRRGRGGRRASTDSGAAARHQASAGAARLALRGDEVEAASLLAQWAQRVDGRGEGRGGGNGGRDAVAEQEGACPACGRPVAADAGGAVRVAGLEAVVRDLAALGYDTRWVCVRAADVGAPHRRERLFAVAYPDGRASASDADEHGLARLRRLDAERRDADGRGSQDVAWDAAESKAPAHTPGECDTLEPQVDGREPTVVSTVAGTGIGDIARHPAARVQDMGRGAGVEFGAYEPAIRRWEHILGRPAPRPTDDRGRLMPEFVEWMMGLPEGWTDGVARTHRFRMLGNAVVWPQAVFALGELVGGAAE